MTIQLIKGDCLELMHDIQDKSIDLILCDLPYGTTANKWDSVIPFDKLWEHYKRICKGAIVLTAQCPFDKKLGSSNLDMLKYEWIWQKNEATGQLNSKHQPMKNHENILVFYENIPTYNPQFEYGHKPYLTNKIGKSENYGSQVRYTSQSDGKRFPKSILKFNREIGLHPTQKPVKLMEYLIRTYTNEGDTTLDNCMGSGTTGVACVNTNRNFIGMELNEEYFNIAQDRINKASYNQQQFNNLFGE